MYVFSTFNSITQAYRSSYHGENKDDSSIALEALGRIPLKLGPWFGCELLHGPLHFALECRNLCQSLPWVLLHLKVLARLDSQVDPEPVTHQNIQYPLIVVWKEEKVKNEKHEMRWDELKVCRHPMPSNATRNRKVQRKVTDFFSHPSWTSFPENLHGPTSTHQSYSADARANTPWPQTWPTRSSRKYSRAKSTPYKTIRPHAPLQTHPAFDPISIDRDREWC